MPQEHFAVVLLHARWLSSYWTGGQIYASFIVFVLENSDHYSFVRYLVRRYCLSN
jgi:hypothetical protein